MKILQIALVASNLLAVNIQDGDQERVFYISAPTEYRNQFADALAALIVQQRMMDV